MAVGLSPATVPTIKSKSVAISASYSNLSMFRLPTKSPGRRVVFQTNGGLFRPDYRKVAQD